MLASEPRLQDENYASGGHDNDRLPLYGDRSGTVAIRVDISEGDRGLGAIGNRGAYHQP
jgi:hypothetical protein